MSAARQVFPFPNRTHPAEQTNRYDRSLERRLCCEVVGAMAGREFDDAVIGIYRSRPKIVDPSDRDLRSKQFRFSR